MANPSTLNAAAIAAAPVSRAEEDAVWSKINWRVVPIILIAYIMAFLDRINVGYTQLQMKQDLAFSDAVYGFGAGLFFITYLLFEVPSNLWMEKIGARLTFLRIMVLWGLASAATALSPNHGTSILSGCCSACSKPASSRASSSISPTGTPVTAEAA